MAVDLLSTSEGSPKQICEAAVINPKPNFQANELPLSPLIPHSRQALTVSPIPSLASPSTLAVRFCLAQARVMMPLIVLANMTNREQDYL